MKIRNGFVSNSSSSSYIIGYGVIKDKQTFLLKLKELGLNTSDYDEHYYNIISPKEIHQYIVDNDYVPEWDGRLPEGKALIPAGNDTVMTIPSEYYNKDLFIVRILNNEEDGSFTVFDTGDSYGRLAWEKAEQEDWYPEDERKIINILKNKDGLFEVVEYKIGAERNG